MSDANTANNADEWALIVDDQPEYLEFVREYFTSLHLKTRSAANLPEAFAALLAQKYRIVLVDMNIPAGEALTPELKTRTPLVEKFPGIAVAQRARNMGYGAHVVIGYTVHDDEAAAKELEKLNCRYVLKGRPDVFKSVVRSSLRPKPD